MARAFSFKAAKDLIGQHRQVLSQLRYASDMPSVYRSRISQSAEEYMTREMLNILSASPIEEISRRKTGIRVKTLREAGYLNLADAFTAGRSQLAAIKGISDEAAGAIKLIASSYASEVRKGVRLRLTTDNKTPEAGRIVTAVYKYLNWKDRAPECSLLFRNYSNDIDRAVIDLSAGSTALRWLFSPRSVKDRAEHAFSYLSDILEGDYGRKAFTYLREFDWLDTSTAEQAWADFEKQPVVYYNIIEETVPGMLGNGDSEYGLPEELAEEVRDESLFTEGLKCTLRRYQQWGVKYILHQRNVLLGDEMGLGKTVQAIAAFVSLANTGEDHFAVVCPASVLANWCREITEKSTLRAVRIHGKTRLSALEDWIRNGGVAVTTYENAEHFRLPQGYMFSMLVADEAHFIKNPETQRTQNVCRIAAHADRLLFMTGTALENRVDEMIALISILNPSLARTIKGMAFMSAAPQFREAVAPVYYRRKREDVLTELPDKIESSEWCEMLPEERKVYEDSVMERNFASARRLSWNVNDPLLSSKAIRMKEIIKEAEEEGRRAIVFSYFLDTIRFVCQIPELKCYGPITGAVSSSKRMEIIEEFSEAPPGAVLVCQITSGGTGLNIQAGSVVVICEPQLKPSTENQAISRAYRMGQTRKVLVYRLLCEDTIDERITDLLSQKQDVFNAFADESVAGNEDLEMDERTFGRIIEEEIERINSKREALGLPGPQN
ncbi:MAG: DEAD/DEAH box helicase [Eubacteriales bacterium]|nr:DEAD/DEAH box helicase [Eubacteriales bacterium]